MGAGGGSPHGKIVCERPAPSARAQLRHRDPREGPLRRREAALAACLPAVDAGACLKGPLRVALLALAHADAVRLRLRPEDPDLQALLAAM